MSAATIRNPFLPPESKPDVARKWLQRHLHKPAPRSPVELVRPRTAPSTGTAEPHPFPAALQRPPNPERSRSNPAHQPDPAPSRPDSGVTRHVNAWLEANRDPPATPIMQGLPYWRSAALTDGATASESLQYAVPIIQPHEDPPSADHSSQHVRDFYRRVRKVQVRMPSLLRTVPQRSATQKPSSSMPALHSPHSTVGAPSDGCNIVLGQTLEGRENTLLANLSARVSRGDSMGEGSDAPTYYTGPPPSYRSRAVSIQTTSSFGCVDGLGPVQRSATQNRSALRKYGMRGKFKELQRKLKAHHK
jgi:hypothetical protein